MQAIQLVSGTVKFSAGKVFETQYGQRVNAVVTLENGEEAKLWGNPDDHELKQLRKGQAVQLVKDTKGYKLVGLPPASNPPSPVSSPQPSIELTPEQKRAIASYVQQQADLFNFALKMARERVEGIHPDDVESLRAIATTLYITAQRKFNL